MGRLPAILVLAMGLSACGGPDSEGPDGGAAADAQPDAFVDLTVEAFDPDHIIEIRIDLPEASWDDLRMQTRSVFDIFGPPCLTQQFTSPFTWFEGDVTIDGTRIDRVAVRKKGFLGSLDPDKPSLIVKLDEYVANQSWSGLDRLTLNNGKQDPTLIHQCLGYGVFAAAGVPAPRCNYAHVTVNGTDLGIYSHVEAVKKPFLRRHFASDEGNLYEGTLADFRDGWTINFEKKTNELDPSKPEIDAMLAAMSAPDDQLLAQLAPLIDVDEYIRMWATEVLIGHWDGYASNTNNFFLYQDPTDGLLHFMPWGADAVFQDPNAAVVAATGVLARRLYLLPETQQRYLDELDALVADVWDESALLEEVDRMEALITPIADPDGTLGLAAQIGTVRQFITERQASIASQLAAGPPPWTQELRGPICFADVGHVELSFATTWGSVNSPNPWIAGTATINATYRGSPVTFTATASVAGLGEDGNPLIAPIGLLPDNSVIYIGLGMAPAKVAPGTRAIDLVEVTGFVFHAPANGDPGSVIAYLRGTLNLTAASMVQGAPVTGTVSADMLFWF